MISLNRTLLFCLVTSVALFSGINSADALIIDNFEAGDFFEDLPAPTLTTATDTQNVGAPDVVGGFREYSVTRTANNGGLPNGPTQMGVGGGTFFYQDGGGANGNGFLRYDADGAGLAADLTDAGGSNLFVIDVDGASSLGIGLSVRVTDGDGDVDVVSFGPLSIGLNTIDFDEFDSSVNFTDIDVVEFIIATGSTGETLILNDAFATTSVPEPSSIALLGMGAFGLLGYGWRRKKKVIVEDVA